MSNTHNPNRQILSYILGGHKFFGKRSMWYIGKVFFESLDVQHCKEYDYISFHMYHGRSPKHWSGRSGCGGVSDDNGGCSGDSDGDGDGW